MNGKGDTELGDTGNNVPVSHAADDGSLRRVKSASILLRLAAAPLCLIALIIMVTDKQTHRFVIPITPPIVIDKTARYNGAKAMVFYVYANAFVAGYLLLHALYSIFTRLTSRNSGFGSSRALLWSTFILDQFAVYFLLSAAAATTEVAYIAQRGDNATTWEQICDSYGKFCNRVGVSVIICFTAILALVVLAALSARQLFGSDAYRHSNGKTATTVAAPKNNGRM